MTGISKVIPWLLGSLFVVTGVGYVLFSENGLTNATINFFQNLLKHTL